MAPTEQTPMSRLSAQFAPIGMRAREMELAEQIPQYQKQYDADLATSLKEPTVTGQQALIASVMHLLPMLVGMAVAKKKGAMIGIDAGQKAGAGYLQNVDATNQREAGRAGLRAKADLERLQELRKEQIDLNKEGWKAEIDMNKFDASERGKDRRADKNGEDIRNGPILVEGFKADVSQRDSRDLGDRINTLLDKMEVAGKPENLAKAGFRDFQSWYDKSTDAAQLRREQQALAGRIRTQLDTGPMNEQDAQRLKEFVGAKFGTPLPTIRRIINGVIDNQISHANNTFAAAQDAKIRMPFKKAEPYSWKGSSSDLTETELQGIPVRVDASGTVVQVMKNGEWVGKTQ